MKPAQRKAIPVIMMTGILLLWSTVVFAAIDLFSRKSTAGANFGLDNDITLSGPAQDGVPVQVNIEIHNYGDETVTSMATAPIEVRLASAQANLITDGNDIKSFADGISIGSGGIATISFTWAPNINQNVTEIVAETNPRATIFDVNQSNYPTSQSVTVEDQNVPPPVETFNCEEFGAPFDGPLTIKKKSKKIIPVKMQLVDAYGYLITDQNITAPPVINVVFNGVTDGDGVVDDA